MALTTKNAGRAGPAKLTSRGKTSAVTVCKQDTAVGSAGESVVHDECSQPKRPKLPSASVLKSLSPDDRDRLQSYICEPIEFIDHPTLHEADADVKLFGVSAELCGPDAVRFAPPVPVATRRSSRTARMPTLSAGQERTLFCRFNYACMKISEITTRFADKPLTGPAARRLLAFATWERLTRERIVALNMPLVLAMAKRTRLTGVDFNEMISEGNMALLRSVEKFDVGRGFKFSTYCCRAILKAFARVAMRAGRYRATFPVEFDPSIERSDFQETKRSQMEADYVDDLKVIMARNMAELTRVEQTVIKERFALQRDPSGLTTPKTLEQVGRIIGVTKERVRQIQNKALKKIRAAMEENYLAA